MIRGRPADDPALPARRPKLLHRRYFLDRFLAAIAAILTTLCIALAAARAQLQPMIEQEFERRAPRHAHRDPAVIRQRVLADVASWHPFDPAAPVHEQYAQLSSAYLTWPPIALSLITCALIALVVERRSDR